MLLAITLFKKCCLIINTKIFEMLKNRASVFSGLKKEKEKKKGAASEKSTF